MSFQPGAHLSLPSTESHPLLGRTILQIIPDLEAGGAERTTVDIAKGLTDVGARALVATEGGRLVAELQAKGGVWLPFPAASKNPLAMAINVRKLALLCRHEGVELIHARSRAPAWVALATARLLRLPFVTTYHGSYASRSAVKTLYNSVMARGDVVIANSAYTAELILAKHGFARDRIRVVNRGTNFSAFAPQAVAPERIQALRTAWGIRAHQQIVLLPGRLTGWKGQRVLIEAARILRDQGDTDTAFILAGDHQGRDGYVRELDQLIAKAGLEGRVRRVGHCSDMPAALLAAAVVAALAFAFGAAAAWRIQHIGQVLSLGYFAITLALIARALERGSIGYGFAAGIVAGFMVLGRDQVALLGVYVLAGLVIAAIAMTPRPWQALKTSLLPLLAGALGALLVATVPILLTAVLAEGSNRPAIDLVGARARCIRPPC